MNDKYSMTLKENMFLVKKNLVSLVYSAGKFENLPTTLLQTDAILNNRVVNGVRAEDVETILDLKRGYQYLLKYSNRQLRFEDLLKINKIVARQDALYPGELRTSTGGVHTHLGYYTPPKVDKEKETKWFNALMSSNISPTSKALEIFLHIAKGQLFWDGNKRTALIAANFVLASNGVGVIILEDSKLENFFELLSNYYWGKISQAKISQWMYSNILYGMKTTTHVRTSERSEFERSDEIDRKMQERLKGAVTSVYRYSRRNAQFVLNGKDYALVVSFLDGRKVLLLHREHQKITILVQGTKNTLTLTRMREVIKELANKIGIGEITELFLECI